jgi:hypothetical protein
MAVKQERQMMRTRELQALLEATGEQSRVWLGANAERLAHRELDLEGRKPILTHSSSS